MINGNKLIPVQFLIPEKLKQAIPEIADQTNCFLTEVDLRLYLVSIIPTFY